MMLPILEFVAQRKEANRSEISKFIIEHFKLEDKDFLQKIKNGTPTYISRISWALFYLATTAQVRSKTKDDTPSKSWQEFIFYNKFW